MIYMIHIYIYIYIYIYIHIYTVKVEQTHDYCAIVMTDYILAVLDNPRFFHTGNIFLSYEKFLSV